MLLECCQAARASVLSPQNTSQPLGHNGNRVIKIVNAAPSAHATIASDDGSPTTLNPLHDKGK
jgi:hypothetical protein